MEFKKCTKYTKPITFVSENELKRIQQASLNILQKIGIKFHEQHLFYMLIL